MPGTFDDLKLWLEGFLRVVLAEVAPQVSAILEDYLKTGDSGIAKESHEYKIQALAQDNNDLLRLYPGNLVELNNRLANLNTQISAAYEGIITALGIPAQEPTPPLWYTAPTTPPPTGDIAQAVWDFPSGEHDLSSPSVEKTMYQTAGQVARFANVSVGYQGIVCPYNPDFRMVNYSPWGLGLYGLDWERWIAEVCPPALDWSHVASGDTVLTFLLREQPTFDWSLEGPLDIASAAGAWYHLHSGGPSTWFCPNFTDKDLAFVYASFNPPTPEPPAGLILAPVWPGITGVTLGTPTTLTDGNVIDGPMDGIIVDITTHPDHAGQYGFGDTVSYAHVGAVLFRSDGDEWESAQQIAVEQHVLCPKAMRSAASATLRVNGGYGGTVTPWTKTL